MLLKGAAKGTEMGACNLAELTKVAGAVWWKAMEEEWGLFSVSALSPGYNIYTHSRSSPRFSTLSIWKPT